MEDISTHLQAVVATTPFNPAAPGPIGGTTPAAITGTTITATTFIAANGTTAAPSVHGAAIDTGVLFTTSTVGLAGGGSSMVDIGGAVGFRVTNTIPIGWPQGAANGNPLDTAISRISAGVMGVGTGAAGSAAGSLNLTNLTTTASSGTGTAAIIDGSNVLRPLTSSEAFKTNIVRGVVPVKGKMDAFFKISPILFDYKDVPARISPARSEEKTVTDENGNESVVTVEIPAFEIEPAREGAKGVFGFSAEELDAAGLPEMLNYDADGKPYSLREHGMLAYLHSALKNHEARLMAAKL